MCTSVPSTALLHYPSLHGQAQQVAERFRKAFVLFSQCNSLYEKNYISSDELEQLCKPPSLTLHVLHAQYIHVPCNYS